MTGKTEGLRGNPFSVPISPLQNENVFYWERTRTFRLTKRALTMLLITVVVLVNWTICYCDSLLKSVSTLFRQVVGRQPSLTPSPAPASHTPWRRPAVGATSLTVAATPATRPARNWRRPAGNGEAAAPTSVMEWGSPGASWTPERLRATTVASWTYTTTKRGARYAIKPP